jgi:hypothetical protein
VWRRAANREPRPAKVAEMSRLTAEGVCHQRTNGPEGNLKRAKTSHKGNKIYRTDSSPWAISKLWIISQWALRTRRVAANDHRMSSSGMGNEFEH